jgi:hypothetical protein
MKNLITYLALIICISANGQADKVNEISKVKLEVENEWRQTVDNQLKQLQAMSVKLYALQTDINNLTAKVNGQSTHITELKLNALKDSLKIDRLEKQINYTQTFIKDSVVFVVDSVDEPVLEINLLGPLHNIGSAWSVNHNGSYRYNHTIANYSYIYFDFKKNLKPNSTYSISFTIQLADPSREALINFWFYDEASNQRLPDGYYEEGKHSFEYTVEGAEKLRMGIRARNNNGGSFDLLDLKVVEK